MNTTCMRKMKLELINMSLASKVGVRCLILLRFYDQLLLFQFHSLNEVLAKVEDAEVAYILSVPIIGDPNLLSLSLP